MSQRTFILVPEDQLTINGNRVIEDEAGDLVALVPDAEDAERIAFSVKYHDVMVAGLTRIAELAEPTDTAGCLARGILAKLKEKP